MYIRKGLYSIDYILSSRLPVVLGKTKFAIKIIDGDKSYMSSERYELFDKKGVKCISCGLNGEYFAKEKHKGQKTNMWHFNLYGFDKFGNEVMLTKDHIIPKSLGGKDELSNYQTLCSNCNVKKGNKM